MYKLARGGGGGGGLAERGRQSSVLPSGLWHDEAKRSMGVSPEGQFWGKSLGDH